MSEFGDHIKKIRLSKGMTLNQVALYSDISAAQLSRIENGKRGVPKPATIRQIADALKVEYDLLMERAGYIDGANEGSKESEGYNSSSVALTEKDERDIAKRMEKLRNDLVEGNGSGDGLSFHGEPLSPEAMESLLESLEFLERQTTRINKKYTPKKHRK